MEFIANANRERRSGNRTRPSRSGIPGLAMSIVARARDNPVEVWDNSSVPKKKATRFGVAPLESVPHPRGTRKTGKLEAEYRGDPSGNIRRMSGEQEILATITGECTEEEFQALCSIGSVRSDRE